MKKNKIVAYILSFALILQIFAIPSITAFAAETPNSDFETVSSNSPSGWQAVNATISSNSNYHHSGSRSIKIEKSKTAESTVTNTALISIDKSGITGDFTLSFGGWYRAQNSNVFMRLDATIYDGSRNAIKTLTGNTVMLSRSSNLCEWTEIVTKEKVSANATYISYKIVLTGVNSVASGDKATVYFDDITCKPVETYSECISDYCDFHALTESGNVSGWSVENASFTVNNGVGQYVGTSSDSKASFKTEKLLPECGYEISANYTSTADCTANIVYYDIKGDTVKTDSVNLRATTEALTLQLDTVVPDAVSAEFYISGNTTLTIDDLYFFKTSSRKNECFGGWTADSLWYPEDANTEAYWQYRYFRVTFNLDSAVNDAFVQMAVDDSIKSIYVNGTFVSTSPYKTINQEGKRTAYVYNIGSKLTTGKNVIAVKVLNCALSAGFMLESYIHCANNQTYHLTANPQNTKVSKLNCTSSHENDYDSFTDSPSNWYAKSFDDSSWETPKKQGIAPYSNLGAGEVAFAYQYSDYFSFTPTSCPNAVVNGNERVATSVNFTSSKNSEIPETVTGLLYDSNNNFKAHIPLTTALSSNKIDFTYKLPDYLPAGNYSVKLDGIGVMGSDDTVFTVTLNQYAKTNPTVSAEKENGSVKLKVNNNTVSPVMYTRPSNASAYYNYSTLSTMENSKLPIYCTYNGYLDGSDGSPIWTGDNQIDYNAFDTEIYRTLDLNKDAYIIVNLALDAPSWWIEANPDEVQKDSNGNSIGKVSFASQKYRNEASAVVSSLVEYMSDAAYSHHIIGVKLTAGKTNEWMNYLRSDDDSVFYTVDYSTAMKNAFKAATGYNSIPAISSRATTGSLVLDPSSNASVIAYNRFLSQCVTDSFLCYAQAVKTAAPNIVVGGYNAYLWFENSSLGIGTSHTTAEQVLSSEYVDFVSSPVNYNERIDGFATGYMTLTDSIAAHGKLYIAEQDNRTIYGHIFGNAGSDNAVGLTNTLNDSVNQLTRDLSTDFISGNGFWFYDMEGGWYNDGQIQSRVKALKEEYDNSTSLNMASNSQVAVFVGSDTYNFLNSDIYSTDTGSRSTRLLSQLYMAQRLELSKMGTSYDTFAVSDLTSESVNVDWSQYKLIIMLSPFNISSEERTAIQNKLKKNGNYILWVYLPGYSNGSSNSNDNISSLVDMTVSVDTPTSGTGYDLYSEITDSNYGSGWFGSEENIKSPRPEITGGSTGTIAKYSGSFSRKTAMAYKTCENYTSVYSAVPGVPVSVLRKLCKNAGVHIYSNDLDTTVQTNSSYISVNSAYSGQQTIYLDNDYGVYDVFEKTFISKSANTINVNLNKGETKVYRLVEVDNPDDYDGGLITNGNFHTKTGENEYAGWTTGKAPIEPKNIVPNGGFEDGLENWDTASTGGNAEVAIDTDNAAEGSNAVKMTLADGSSQGYLQGYQFDVVPDRDYVLSYKLKITPNAGGGNGAQCYAYVYEFDESGNATGGLINSTGKWNTENGEYETVTYEFKTLPTTKTIRIDLMHNAVAGTSYWDDIFVSRTAGEDEPQEPVNLVTNGGFETDFEAWDKGISGGAVAEVFSDNVCEGKKAVKMHLTSGSEQCYLQGNQFALEPSTTYELSYKLKIVPNGDGNGAQCYAIMYEFDGSGTPSGDLIPSTGRWNTVNGEYETVTYQFTTKSNTQNARIDLMHNGVAGTSYWDDVKVTKVSTGENVLPNGGFENDFFAWGPSASGNATLTIIHDKVAEGSKGLKVYLPSASDQCYMTGYQFNVKPSTTYELSYKLKIAPNAGGGNGAQCYAYVYEFNEGGTPTGGLIDSTGRWNTANGDYETVTYQFTTGADTKTARIDLLHNGVAGTSYWDDVKVLEVISSTEEETPVLSESSKIYNGVKIEGDNSYLACVALPSNSNSSYALRFDGLIQNSGKVRVTVYRSDMTTVVKRAELLLNDSISHNSIAVPSSATEEYYVRITLVDANEDSSLHIGNVSMKLNKGDFDNNGSIASDDFVTLQNVLLGITSVNEWCDLNGDSAVNIVDLVKLKRYASAQ